LNKYLKLMRVEQYVKNIIVLLPLLFSGQLFQDGKILPTLLGVLMFCFVSSAVYVMNDIADAKSDAANPAKCHRPIASGVIPKRNAYILCISLFLISALVSLFVLPFWSGVWIIIYFVMNIFYSLGLKNIVFLDVAMIVVGFLIRVAYGTIVADVEISKYFYFVIGFTLTFTTMGKRLNEKRRMERTGLCVRKVLEKCSERSLALILYLSLILMNIFYVIWVSDIVPVCATNPLWTIPIMVLFSYKCFVIIENNTTDQDPLALFIRDKVWFLSLIVLIVSIVITFYVEVPFINDGIRGL